MIAKIKFEGVVNDGKKKSVLPDSLKIHIQPGGKKTAKEIFARWMEKSNGIRGDSGVFHPLGGFGTIEIKGVEEVDG